MREGKRNGKGGPLRGRSTQAEVDPEKLSFIEGLEEENQE
jgi:hypothetical protein